MHPAFLAVAVFLPFIGGLVSYALRDKYANLKKPFTLAVTVITTAAVWCCALFCRSRGFTLFYIANGLSLTFRLDGLGSFFACLVASLWPFAAIYAFKYMENEHHQNMFFMFYTMTYGATLGIAMSENLLTMYCFYEVLTLVTLPLIIQPMTKKAIRAGRKYLYLSLGGSAFAFIGLVLLISRTGSADFIYGGLTGGSLSQTDLIVYMLTFLGFGVKSVIFPFHIWLPDATVAPTPVTALLHAVAVVKSGAFAIIRLTYYNYGADALRGTWVQQFCLAVALLTILYGSSMAVRERHLKRRLAYSTVANLSYIIFGAMLMTPMGLAAGLLHMLFHAVTKITSFCAAGSVMKTTGREYVFQLDGLGRKMPVTFGVFTVSALSLTGIPVFCGFFSKWQLCAAALSEGGFLPVAGVAVLLISALLTAIYMFSIVIRAFFRKGEDLDGIHEAPWQMSWMFTVFAAAMLLLGIFARPVIALVTDIASGIL